MGESRLAKHQVKDVSGRRQEHGRGERYKRPGALRDCLET